MEKNREMTKGEKELTERNLKRLEEDNYFLKIKSRMLDYKIKEGLKDEFDLNVRRAGIEKNQIEITIRENEEIIKITKNQLRLKIKKVREE